MKPPKIVTALELRDRFHYDPENGLFTRLKTCPPFSASAIGSIAGCRHSSGYWHIKIRCRQYKAHRLAWLYMTGEWPISEIDHIDMDPGNNRWANLRAATRSENQCNIGRRKNNKSGIKGVCWDNSNRKWIATITVDGVQCHLGYFSNAVQAGEAYRAASAKFHGQFARAT